MQAGRSAVLVTPSGFLWSSSRCFARKCDHRCLFQPAHLIIKNENARQIHHLIFTRTITTSIDVVHGEKSLRERKHLRNPRSRFHSQIGLVSNNGPATSTSPLEHLCMSNITSHCYYSTTPTISDYDGNHDGSDTVGLEYDSGLEHSAESINESQLSIETDNLVERIKQKDKGLDVEECYFVLETWIDAARSNRSRFSDNLNAARRAQEILDALESNRIWSMAVAPGQKKTQQRHTVLIPPRSSFYDVVLQAYAVCGGGIRAAEAAERLLDRMLDQCRRFQRVRYRTAKATGNSHFHNRLVFPVPPEPTTKTFNIAIHAWAKSGIDEAGQRAECILWKMEQWKRECNSFPEEAAAAKVYYGSFPNTRTWLSLMNAWARKSTEQSRIRVVEILHKIKADHEEAKKRTEGNNKNSKDERNLNNPQQDLLVGADVCNTALKVFVDRKMGRDGALKAEQVLRFYENWHANDWLVSAPDSRSYTLVVDAWAHCGTEEGAQRAEAILNTMIRQFAKGEGVSPHPVTFTTCILAWTRLKKPPKDLPDKAEAMLMQVVNMYEQTGDKALRPDTNICNVVMSCWVRAMDRPDAIDRAKQVFDKAKRYAKPDIVTYNTLLDGYNKRGKGADALHLLHWLESSSTYLEPDRISYNTALAAVSRDRTMGPDDALALLERMKHVPPSSRAGLVVKPDKKSYTTVLWAWRNSNRVSLSDAERAAALVSEMEKDAEDNTTEYDLRPDAFLLTILIQVCAKVQGHYGERAQALQLALETMDKLDQGRYGKPNANSYEAVMQSICLLCDEEDKKTRLLRLYFEKCAASGYVSDNVVQFMIRGKAWEDNIASANALEEPWFRNVPSHQQPTKKNQQSS